VSVSRVAPAESQASAAPATEAPPAGDAGSRYPLVVLVGGMLLLAAFAAIVGAQVSTWALDETMFKASAVHYGSGLPENLFHDLTARATTRLYSLTLTPFFTVFDGDVAVRIAKVWNALLFVSAAIPSYLLARTVLASRWHAVATGLLCVALPWLTLSTSLFAESLAYPVSIWLSYSIVRSVRDPSARRDAVVVIWCVVAVVSRVQLVAIFGGYVALLVAFAFVEAPGGTELSERVRVGAARMRRTPFTMSIAAAGLIVILSLAVTGSLQGRIDRALGGYGEFQYRTTLPSDVPIGAVVEFISLALGVGVVPAMLALAWYPAAFRDRLDPAARALAWTALAVTSATFAFTLAAQGGYIAQLTEERGSLGPPWRGRECCSRCFAALLRFPTRSTPTSSSRPPGSRSCTCRTTLWNVSDRWSTAVDWLAGTSSSCLSRRSQPSWQWAGVALRGRAVGY
jgi:hypothetical protein